VDWPSNRVGSNPETGARGQARKSLPESCGVYGQEKLDGELQVVRTVNRHRWVRRVASGERVKRGQGTRHNDPVTSEEGMPGWVSGFAP
jgi:hypothetical protein